MVRAAALIGLVALGATMAAGCSMTPLVTKERMSLGEADITGMECRRIIPANSNIPKKMCAKPESWAKFDTRQADIAANFIDDARDGNDNRMLYPR